MKIIDDDQLFLPIRMTAAILPTIMILNTMRSWDFRSGRNFLLSGRTFFTTLDQSLRGLGV